MDPRTRASRRLAVPLTALIALAAGCLPATAAAEVPSRTLAQSPAAVEDYWTAKRMRSARPASELLAGIPSVSDALDNLLGDGTPTARAAAQPVGNPKRARVRTHGKVLFSLPSGDYVCSGTVVRAKTKRLVVTAGHCVFGEGRFASNWMFVPAKDGSSEPYGRWTAARLATTRQFHNREDARFDVGMASVRSNNGRRLQQVVGGRGIAFNQGRSLRIKAFGYPAESPYDGTRPYACLTRAEGTDNTSPPKPTRIDCDMTGGASGGGWVIRRGRVNSVTSYGYEAFCPLPLVLPCRNPEAGKLFGPYFGKAIRRLYLNERVPGRR